MTPLTFTLTLADPAFDEGGEATITVERDASGTFTIVESFWTENDAPIPASIIEANIDRIGDRVDEEYYDSL